MTKVYITNLGKYNEGELCGKWIELPIEEKELNKAFDEIKICHEDEEGNEIKYYDAVGNPYEEYFFSDFETDIKGLNIEEYSHIEDLNELNKQLEDLTNEEELVLSGLLTEGGYSIEEAMTIVIDQQNYSVFYDCFNMSDVAEQVVEQYGYLEEMPEHLRRYFNYEAFGRDLEIDGNYVYCGEGIYVEVYAY